MIVRLREGYNFSHFLLFHVLFLYVLRIIESFEEFIGEFTEDSKSLCLYGIGTSLNDIKVFVQCYPLEDASNTKLQFYL